jgi:tetratricopeptide (TPR) repeat protein
MRSDLEAYQSRSGPRQLDESVRIADITAIREHLANDSLDEAASCLNLALLSFPHDLELKKLESEIEQKVQQHERYKDLIAQAEAHVHLREWELAVQALESAQRLETANSVFARKRTAEVLVAWARDLFDSDKEAAISLVERSLILDSDNPEAPDLHARLLGASRKEVVDQALNSAREFQRSGQLMLAVQTLERALKKAPEDAVLRAYLNKLFDLEETEKYQRDLIAVQEGVKKLADAGKFGEAEHLVRLSLKDYPQSERIQDLLRQVKSGQQQQLAGQIAETSLRDIKRLEDAATVPALKQALQLANSALDQLSFHPQLFRIQARLEERIKDSQATFEAGLFQIEQKIVEGEFRAAKDLLQSAATLDPTDPRLEHVRARLRQARFAHLRATHWKTGVAFASFVVVLGVGVFLLQGQSEVGPSTAQLTIATLPQNARVYVNDEYSGNTPYELNWEFPNSDPVELRLKLELENYETFEQTLRLSPNETRTLNPRLRLTNLAAEMERLYQLAGRALQAGNLITPPESSALAYLDQMKEADPADQMGQSARLDALLAEIKSRYKSKLLAISPRERNTETELSMLEQFIAFEPNDAEINSRIQALNQLIQRQMRDIDAAIARGDLLSSTPGSALALLAGLETRFPRQRPRLLTKRNEIRGSILETARQRCGSATDCSSFVDSALRYYPNDSELRSILDLSRRVDEKGAAASSSATPSRPDTTDLRARMEDAFRAKRYVWPQSSSAVYFANEILKIVQNDSRASDLKQTSRAEAEREAESLLGPSQDKRALVSLEEANRVREQFGQAQKTLEAIHFFWPTDDRSQRQLNQLATRIRGIDELLSAVGSYPVVHDHALGSCKGWLTVNAYGIRYQAERGDHSFDRKFEEYRSLERLGGGRNIELRFADNRRLKVTIDTTISALGSVSTIESLINSVTALRERF